jgi:predicted GNAT family acetyltransferase
MTISVQRLTDRARIQALLERDRSWSLYALGDLDDGLFEQCEWYTAGNTLALIFKGLNVFPLVTVGGADGIAAILENAITAPQVFLNQQLAHLSAVLQFYECPKPSHMQRMMLANFKPVDGMATQLGIERLAELETLYREGQCADAFAPYQLATGYFYGVEADGQLVSVAGVHLASRAYGVGPIGNVCTLPAYRGRGYAALCASAVVRALQADGITTIGLNVEQNNTGAIRVYERLGFVKYCEFIEGLAHRKP